MVLNATFPTGITELTVNGLHQWDYGQQLEICADDLPALIEVHFACMGMREAEVRVCSIVDGVGVVTIPDTCLEQSAPIMAWIYEINGTAGTTTKAITLKVIPRAKPAPSETVPVEVYDKYTEAITAMDAQVEALRSGIITVQSAVQAERSITAEELVTDSKRVTAKTLIEVIEGYRAVPVAERAEMAGYATEATILRNGGVSVGRELLWEGEESIKSGDVSLTVPLKDWYSLMVIEYSYNGTLDVFEPYHNRGTINARTVPFTVIPDTGTGTHYVDIPIFWHEGGADYIRITRTSTTSFKFTYYGTLEPLNVAIRKIYLEY